MTAAVTAEQAVRGRNTISSRAVRRVVSAVTAEELGDLTVIANAPIHVSPLGVDARRGGTILERLARAQSNIREKCLHITGSTITRVDLHITGAQLDQRRRVS